MSLVTRNTALVLYGVLLVLPTIVLGGLHFHQLLLDHQVALAAVPGDAADAGRRLSEAFERRVRDLIERESLRPFYHYKKSYFSPGTVGAELAFVPSPLSRGPVPEGVLGWFSYDLGQGGSAVPELYSGGRTGSDAWKSHEAALLQATQELVLHDWREGFIPRMMRLRSLRSDPHELRVAAINASRETDLECLERDLPALEKIPEQQVSVLVSDFNVRFYRESDGTPRILASRTVRVPSNRKLQDLPDCFSNVARGASIVQGFYIDPVWLFGELPLALSNQMLDVSQQFLPPGSPLPPPDSDVQVISTINPIRELGFETYDEADKDFGAMRIAADVGDLGERFRSQSLNFLGVAGMLVLSLGTGMVLLLRSVRQDLEAARRTENFVAAVTHELRTPLSAIRLYGEMLEEGWVEDPAKRAEYYRRIVRETGRLETLVERVLEKSQLATNEVRPEPGDVNRPIEALRHAIVGVEEGRQSRDVSLELDYDLPAVMLIHDAVRSIVTNLVENARKYAPVDFD
ncbi:MAG: HAMP domain-containing histidine kinase [Actinomycetota bacterium]|nr:HAMP domain-containing histidine kinase [Actinomycetota bacterium]